MRIKVDLNKKLTRRQAAIISAYTGVLSGPFEDLHKYVNSMPGMKGISIIGMGMFAEKIKEYAKPDFIAMLATEDSSYV